MIKLSWGKKGPDKAVTIAADVNVFVATPDGDWVYYIDGSELYRVNGSNGKSRKKVADDVLGGSLWLGKGEILYFEMNSDEGIYTLYASSNGKSFEPVLDSPSSPSGGHLGYYYIKSDDAVYCTTGTKKLKKIYTIS